MNEMIHISVMPFAANFMAIVNDKISADIWLAGTKEASYVQ